MLWAVQAQQQSWHNFRPFQAAPCLLQVGIFSTVGNPSRTGDVERSERKGKVTNLSSRNKADIFELIAVSLAKALSLAFGV